MRIVGELYWPLEPDYWVKCLESDPLELPWFRVLELFAQDHEVTICGVGLNGASADFDFRGVRYRIRPNTTEWRLHEMRPDIVVHNSPPGFLRGFPKVERFRILYLHGEFQTLHGGDPGLQRIIRESDFVFFRNPYERPEVEALGQRNCQWLPAGINQDLVRSFASDRRHIDLIGNVARPGKRPEYVNAVIDILGKNGFGCDWIGCLPKADYLWRLNRSRVYLHASLSEGWCRTVSEALAAGCLIACGSPSRAVVEQTKAYSGVILPPDDVSAAAAEIARILTVPGPFKVPDLPIDSFAKTEIDSAAVVVDRAIWCLTRGREFQS